MAPPSASALVGYILERMRSDAHFLHSQGILDAAERDTIVLRLDGASHRVSSSSSVSALTAQFSAAAVTSSSNNAPPPALSQSQHQQPPPMPARMAYGAPQDNRERVKALWAYNGT